MLPITPVVRKVSDAGTYVRATRADAVNAALAGTAAPGSVIYPNILGIWPELAQYNLPNNGSFSNVPNPSFIWDSPNFIEGELRGFATVVDNVPTHEDFVIFLAAFADNAHTAFIELYRNGVLVRSISNTLADGSLDPATQETPPFNWQRVRLYSKNFNTNVRGNDGDGDDDHDGRKRHRDRDCHDKDHGRRERLQLVLSFEVRNYLNNGNPPTRNPAALAFLADLYRG